MKPIPNDVAAYQMGTLMFGGGLAYRLPEYQVRSMENEVKILTIKKDLASLSLFSSLMFGVNAIVEDPWTLEKEYSLKDCSGLLRFQFELRDTNGYALGRYWSSILAVKTTLQVATCKSARILKVEWNRKNPRITTEEGEPIGALSYERPLNGIVPAKNPIFRFCISFNPTYPYNQIDKLLIICGAVFMDGFSLK